MRYFSVDSGEKEKEYTEDNFTKFFEENEHQYFFSKNTRQKGPYDKIRVGDILILKTPEFFVAYGKVKKIDIDNREYWGYKFYVEEWISHNPENRKSGVSCTGLNSHTEEGGRHSAVKQLSESFAYQKMKEIDSENRLFFKVTKKRFGKKGKQKPTITGVPSGIRSVDEITYGWQKSDLIVLAGRPGMGKTSFATTIMKNAVTRHNTPVVYFSLELSKKQLMSRVLSAIDVKDEWFDEFLSGFLIDDTSHISVSNLENKARRLHSLNNIGLIIVDYLQLLEREVGEDKADWDKNIGFIVRSLKGLAVELNIPIIVLSQLSREVDKREDKAPQLSDIKYFNSIEKYVDVFMFLYRDSYYNSYSYNKESYTDNTKLIIRKIKSEEAEMAFNRNHGSFDDLL